MFTMQFKYDISQNKNLLMCHHCAINIKFSNECLNCNSKDIAYLGEGTEKIEEIIRNEFKEARIIRIDLITQEKKEKLKKYLKM